jgi:hypothetical protein
MPPYYTLSGLHVRLESLIQGRRASRLPLAFILRAFGAVRAEWFDDECNLTGPTEQPIILISR